MILFAIKKSDTHRKVLDISPFCIEWRGEYKSDDIWRYGYGYISICITKYFLLGSEHLYYDGPHCSFSLGWLHINWQLDYCAKCEADRTDYAFSNDDLPE